MKSELSQEQKDKSILPDLFYMRCLSGKFMEREKQKGGCGDSPEELTGPQCLLE
jgi:hypothetical protein